MTTDFSYLHELDIHTQEWLVNLVESLIKDGKAVMEEGKVYDSVEASMSDEVEGCFSRLVDTVVVYEIPDTKEEYEYNNGDIILNGKFA